MFIDDSIVYIVAISFDLSEQSFTQYLMSNGEKTVHGKGQKRQ